MLRSLCRFHNVHRPYLGIDTVHLSGEGFESFVKVGEKVTAGQKRLSFDLNLIKTKSAITPLSLQIWTKWQAFSTITGSLRQTRLF
ncbi:PTS glucose transporter subunit IIA [Shouchella tritolerans]|uniref:PTS glucose transporter subunit IIA n=1 Tax=Shouchella tritolerans TaxID=2979466 RepID=UPI0009EE1CCC